MEKVISSISFDYRTIKTTKSRIEKGLLAIPVSLIDLFPKNKKKIILVNHDNVEQFKTFTPYNSSSRECRIGGMREFYNKYKIRDSEELVILLLDDDKFKIIPEKLFTNEIISLEKQLESANDEDSEDIFEKISNITNIKIENIIQNEFVRLSNHCIQKRKKIKKSESLISESVPQSYRKILLNLYKGKCQLSAFTFIMKNGKPYFEIHHIDPNKGNNFKNLLVVSPNIHMQFEYAKKKEIFDDEGWIRKVYFNNREYPVFQIIDFLKSDFTKEIHL